MLNIISTQNSAPIIGWCAQLLGMLMELIYKLFSSIGIENIALCIVVFTVLVKLVMIPLTVKQQKFSKLSVLMNPEIQEVQKKYKNKRDQESMTKMNEETQAIYQKYGTSPTGSCLQLLIQMPILFSLYYIIGGIPAYVQPVYEYYTPVTDAIISDYDYYEFMDDTYDKYVLEKDEKDEYKYVDEMLDSFDKISEKKLIDVLSKYSTKQWDNLIMSYENINKMAIELSENVTDEEWGKVLSEVKKEDKEEYTEFVEAIKNNDISDYIDGSTGKDSTVEVIKKAEDKVMEINQFGPINLSQAPGDLGKIAYIIPILCFLTQWLSVQISTKSNSQQLEDNPMGNSMKVMNIMMPLMSAFIAISVPAGLGFYWALSGVIQIITQLCLNAYFKKVDVQDIIDANVAKMNKRKEKMGIDPTKVTNTASTSTKTIKSKTNVSNSKSNSSGPVKYKQGSMAQKANMVKEYNDKNRK